MFTDLYLQTTNPNLPFSSMFRQDVFIGIFLSVLFHTIIYAGAFNLASYIFLGKLLSKIVNISARVGSIGDNKLGGIYIIIISIIIIIVIFMIIITTTTKKVGIVIV